MRPLGPEDVLHAVDAWYPDAVGGFAQLKALRGSSPGFLATWWSALLATGVTLPASALEELAERARRYDRLAAVRRGILARWPDAYSYKGPGVRDLYPAGLERTSNDLDLVVPDAATLWEVVHAVRAENDMSVHAVATFPVPDGGEPGVAVSLHFPAGHALEEPLAVDVSNVVLLSDGADVPPLRSLPVRGPLGAAENLLMVAAERLEGPFTVKDVFDTAVLAGHAPDVLPRAVSLARRTHLLPELLEALRRAADLGLPMPGPAGAATAGAARRTAAARRVASLRRLATDPVPHALAALCRGARGGARARGALWRRVDRTLAPTAPVRGRLWRFGVPAVAAPDADAPVLRTPLGDFLLVNGDEVDPDRFAGVVLEEG